MANICVFCTACNPLNKEYENAAEELGNLIGKNKHNLIYGGSQLGLMGIVAKAVQKNGGKVIGVIPEYLKKAALGEDELINSRNMFHRKEIMEDKGDAFIALPGGCGTIDEILDILVGIQLKIHNKPLSIINTNNYYEDLIKQFNKVEEQGFNSKTQITTKKISKLYHIANNAKEALDFIEQKLKNQK